MTTNNNFDGQKHCTCKKSKCLKLYCECFSAGLYCDESCTCQECFNRTDYEDTVDEARQQIVSRNPHAFSSKIDSLKQSPTNHNVEDGDKRIPNAGKHKKGCNCKKSMCAKRYCECYQANVGCSSECRCEGCKNVFGKKGEYNMYNESSSTRAINETEFCTPQKLTPTPFQHSENFDMSTLDQDSPHNVEFTNQFTPPGATMMDWPNSSRVSSVNSLHLPGSFVTPAAVTSPDDKCMIVPSASLGEN
ncbi:CRC domain-containing protein [Tanacetum coccineum]